MLFTLFSFVVALGLLITFHEFGHYWVARRCGVKVLRFSLGFGKVLLKRVDRNGTEWALSAIPLGGYVKMLDDPQAEAGGADADQAFNRKSVGKRFAIVAAGPAANLLLAAVLYGLLGLIGTQEPAAILAQPAVGTPAAQAGMHGGDRIEAINGRAVQSWGEVRWALMDTLASGGTAAFELQTPEGRTVERSLALPRAAIEPDSGDLLKETGLALATPRPRVTQITPGSAADHAGLQAGDEIVGVDGQPNPSATQLVGRIKEAPDQPVTLTLLRHGAQTSVTVVPQLHIEGDGSRVGRIGVMLGAEFPMVTVRYGVIGSITHGISRTAETVWFSLKMMGRMVTGNVSVRNISGPVTIADYAGQTARVGLAAYIGFLALISVSIGVLNLLPIPMLDGGHLMYYVLEIIRGKPVPDHWLETGQRVGLGLLAALMGLAFFNDFSRLFS